MVKGEKGAGAAPTTRPPAGTDQRPDGTTTPAGGTWDRVPRAAWSSLPAHGRALAVAVLAAMAHHANRRGETYIGVEALAELVGVDRRTVQRARQVLRDAGLLEVVAPASRYRPTTYRIDGIGAVSGAAPVSPLAGSGAAVVSPLEAQGRRPCRGRGDTHVVSGVTPAPPESDLREPDTREPDQGTGGERARARGPRKRGTPRDARAPIPSVLLSEIPDFPELWRERLKGMNRRPTPSAEGKQLAGLADRLPKVGAEAIRAHVGMLAETGWQTIAFDRLDRDAGGGKANGRDPRRAGRTAGLDESRLASYDRISSGTAPPADPPPRLQLAEERS